MSAGMNAAVEALALIVKDLRQKVADLEQLNARLASELMSVNYHSETGWQRVRELEREIDEHRQRGLW